MVEAGSGGEEKKEADILKPPERGTKTKQHQQGRRYS